MSIVETKLPQLCDLSAEQCVLGSIILEPEQFHQAGELKPADFSDLRHSALFDICGALIKGGRGLDLVILCSELDRLGLTDSCGGREYVASHIETVPNAINLPYYVDIVRQWSIKRKVFVAAYELAQASANGTSPDALINRMAEQAYELRKLTNTGRRWLDVGESADDFLARDIPELESIVEGVLFTDTINIGYSWRGLGKSQVFGGSLAAEVATGGTWLYWNVPKPRRVLYIDGELQASYLKWVIHNWLNGRDGSLINLIASDTFYDKFGRPMDLTRDEDQAGLITHLNHLGSIGRRPELIILDNLSTLFWGMEDTPSGLEPLKRCLLNLRHMGYTLFLIDHAGKNKDARGARGFSGKEDGTFTVLKLEEPEVPSMHGSAKFKVEFTKTRGRMMKPSRFNCEMVPDPIDPQYWIWELSSSTDDNANMRLLKWIYEHKPQLQAEIAEAFGVSSAAISRQLKQLRSSGYVEGLDVTAKGAALF